MTNPNFKLEFTPNFSHGFDLMFGNIFDSDDDGDTIPTDGLLMLYDVASGVDSVGLSVADYDLVDASVRGIFFSDPSTLVDTTTAYTNAIASPLLNIDTMIGSEVRVILLLYQAGTDRVVLDKALKYVGEQDPSVVSFPYTFPFILG